MRTPSIVRTIQLLLTSAFAITLTLVVAPQSLQAAVIYNNLGPNDTFHVQPGTYPVWNLSSGGYIHRAASFTVPGSQNVQFGSADLGLFLQSGSNLARIELTANTSGNFPGAVLETINLNLPAPSANPTISTFVSQTNPTLVAGNTYWVVASMLFSPSMATWGWNTTGALGGNATRTNFMNGQWFNQGPSGVPSLRINAKMIPEPAALLLVLIGASALALACRSRLSVSHRPTTATR